MSEETTNVSKKRILKSLKYLVLTVAILIGATGVSNANTFTVTGTVICNSQVPTLVDVTTSDLIAFGDVYPTHTATIDFAIVATNEKDCTGVETLTTGGISVSFSDPENPATFRGMRDSCSAACTTTTDKISVYVTFPAETGGYSETITFSIT